VLARLCCGVAVLERLLRMCCVALRCNGFRGPRRQIFFQDPTQQKVAESYIAQLSKAAVFPGPIVTRVAPDFGLFPAEQYHQDFMNSNPSNPYIAINDMPKLHDLKQLFPALYRDQPVLMLASGKRWTDSPATEVTSHSRISAQEGFWDHSPTCVARSGPPPLSRKRLASAAFSFVNAFALPMDCPRARRASPAPSAAHGPTPTQWRPWR
jgi:hypothetical protein